jgi:hypothetical protein
MTLLKTSFALWLGFIVPAWGHEFWIEPFAYALTPETKIEANLRVGSDFVGPDYIFIPKGYDFTKFVTPSGINDIEFTGQDNPSLSFDAVETGLHTIVLISKSSKLKHDDFAAFSAFAETVGRESEAAAARRDGPIREAYFRYAKALIAVGGGAGQDRAYGAIYEWVSLDNPYTTPDGPLKFQLFFNGKPAADEPVQVFARNQDVGGEVPPVHLRTNADGVLMLPDNVRGEIMLNSVKLLPADSDHLDWISYWASVTFARPVLPQ